MSKVENFILRWIKKGATKKQFENYRDGTSCSSIPFVGMRLAANSFFYILFLYEDGRNSLNK